MTYVLALDEGGLATSNWWVSQFTCARIVGVPIYFPIYFTQKGALAADPDCARINAREYRPTFRVREVGLDFFVTSKMRMPQTELILQWPWDTYKLLRKPRGLSME